MVTTQLGINFLRVFLTPKCRRIKLGCPVRLVDVRKLVQTLTYIKKWQEYSHRQGIYHWVVLSIPIPWLRDFYVAILQVVKANLLFFLLSSSNNNKKKYHPTRLSQVPVAMSRTRRFSVELFEGRKDSIDPLPLGEMIWVGSSQASSTTSQAKTNILTRVSSPPNRKTQDQSRTFKDRNICIKEKLQYNIAF